MTSPFSWQNSISPYHQSKHPTHINSLGFCYYYYLFKDGKREAQKEQVTYLRSQSWQMVKLGFEPRSLLTAEKAMAPHSSSCLENQRDGGAWWAAVYGVQQVRHD